MKDVLTKLMAKVNHVLSTKPRARDRAHRNRRRSRARFRPQGVNLLHRRSWLAMEFLEDRRLLSAGHDFGATGMMDLSMPLPSIVERQILASVVALDQPLTYNRLGAYTDAGMIYALRRDVVHSFPEDDPLTLNINETSLNGLTEQESHVTLTAGNVALRADKRPRPLTLRVNVGDVLNIRFQNLLAETRVDAQQPADRHVGIHVSGMQLLEDIGDDGSNVGRNDPLGGSIVAPGGKATYKLFAEYENTFLLSSMGVTAGAEGTGGTIAFGLFGAVTVEPWGTDSYRSQLTRVEMDMAAASWADETQIIGNDATGGTFTLSFGASAPTETVAINWEASASVVQTALEGLGDINPGDVIVSALNVLSGPAQAWVVQFTGGLGAADQPLLVANDGLLTGHTIGTKVSELQGGAQPQVDGSGQLRVRTTPAGQPIINYDAQYPTDPAHPYFDPGKAGLPIIRMLMPRGNFDAQIVHSDLNGFIAGPAAGLDGIKGTADDYRIPPQSYPASYWSNDIYNPAPDDLQNGGEPFREFTVIFHDEAPAIQAFPGYYNDPEMSQTLDSVRDAFMVNYGSGGIGSEIIANRLGVGPMWNGVDLKYEEFFLSAWAVGDPAMIVDIPANAGLETLGPNDTPNPDDLGPKATKALFPDDPSNVHHSYLNDRVKFRNLHAGPKEQHIFHLHAHQWQTTWNTEKSNYLDSQGIGPGDGFTYEIAYGGSGNRNKTIGDSLFHCHFYPHFAMGMWSLFRTHDTFEFGTKLDANGRPASGARALPDGEIVSGTPIPGVVPLPTVVMAPMPDPNATVAPHDLDGDVTTGIPMNTDGDVNTGVDLDTDGDGLLDLFGVDAGWDSSQIDLDGNGVADLEQRHILEKVITNPGYPFFVPGVAGHRAPSPPVDLVDDGGLPRHVITSGPKFAAGAVEQVQTRLDFNKVLHKATALQLPEGGTPGELAAMAFHANRFNTSYLPDGTPFGDGVTDGFETNGLPPQRGAPFADPLRGDDGLPTGVDANGDPMRIYKAADFQIDLKLNKDGWHFPQQRLIGLWDDVVPTMTGQRAPEPLVMRLNAGDGAEYLHTNLVPSVYEVDDFQVRTPTDIIGQHIHLVKFDVLAADGSANGFNYEDGTFSPDEVRERIEAFNGALSVTGNYGFTDLAGNQIELIPEAHPFFGPTGPNGENWLGARTTVQRWYADPLLNNAWDNGLGTVFTHDHFGPSTHQQVGLYATVLIEPEGSTWRDSETGTSLGRAVDSSLVVGDGLGRPDGGPTSWRADILFAEVNPITGENMSHREFYLEFADFQHAYQDGGGLLSQINNENGLNALMIPSYADFTNAINPPVRAEPPQNLLEDLVWFPPEIAACECQLQRPFPEAISADDPGTYVVNYRNEPVGLRVFDPATGLQALGDAGDLALAFQSRTDRIDQNMNVQPGFYPPLSADVRPGDPFTPLLRTYQGDKVRIRTQVGGHEEEHNLTIHGLKWRQEGLYENSGWRNSQFAALSEYFNIDVPVLPDVGSGLPQDVDYMYEMGAQTEDLWNGIWGIMRSYAMARGDLLKLPNNQIPDAGWTVTNAADFDELGPLLTDGQPTQVRDYNVVAVRAADVLGPEGLVYNDRTVTLVNPDGTTQVAEGLIDPTALMYVLEEDLVRDLDGNPVGLKEETPIEPLILRANAGDIVKVHLTNELPAVVPDMPGFNTLPPIIHKDENVNGGIVTFNSNDLTPSSLVGLHPQLVAFNVRTDDGSVVGFNESSLVAPGETRVFTWYAGDVSAETDVTVPGGLKLVARPVEFGAVNLMPADRIKGSNKGLVGALVIEPQEARWATDPGTNASATVWQDTDGDGLMTLDDPNTTAVNEDERLFREFVTVIQDDANLRYGGHPAIETLAAAVPNIAGEGPGVPEDPQDSGQKAINYSTEPLWFRLGIAPNTPFEQVRDNTDIHRAFSNDLVGGDPRTPVFIAGLDGPDKARFRVLQPGGHARGHNMTVHGHPWQREPYVNGSDSLMSTWHENPTDMLTGVDADGNMPGHNMVSWWQGTQGGVGPSSHFDFVVRPGGRFQVPGDYLFRDQASFGSYQGLWGILRVTELFVIGTAGDDLIVVDSIDRSVTVNDVRYQWDESLGATPFIMVDAGAGNDTLRLYGSAADDLATMRIGSVNVVSGQYEVEAVKVENIFTYGRGGNNTAYFHDDPNGTDEFRAWPTRAWLRADGSFNWARSFRNVYAYGTPGNSDVATLFDKPNGIDTFSADPHVATLSGNGYSNQVASFRYVHAYSTQGNNDAAYLHDDPTADDTFKAWPDQARLYGDNHYNRAISFRNVYAYSTPAGNDLAVLMDNPNGIDTFLAYPHLATLSGNGYSNQAASFRYVHAYSTQGNNDAAYLHDNPTGNDTLKAWPDDAKLYGDDYLSRALSFRNLYAYGTPGNNDLAILFDSSGNDTFEAWPKIARLFGPGYSNEVGSFRFVHAFDTAGGTDVAWLYGSAARDVFVANARFSKLRGADFYNRAVSFEQVHAYGGGGRNIGVLYDAVLEAGITDPPPSALAVWLHEFSRIRLRSTAPGSEETVIKATDQVFTAYWE